MYYLKQKSRDKSDLTSLRKVTAENSQNIHSEAVLSPKISKTGLNIYAFLTSGFHFQVSFLQKSPKCAENPYKHMHFYITHRGKKAGYKTKGLQIGEELIREEKQQNNIV